MLALDGTDYPLCQRSLYGTWRMTLAFREDTSIVIVAIARHTKRENPNRVIAEVFPRLSAVGRRRSEQPPCCEGPGAPPQLAAELRSILDDIFGV